MMPRIMRRLRYLSTILDDYSRYIIAWSRRRA
jgi:transposase InsO family protein